MWESLSDMDIHRSRISGGPEYHKSSTSLDPGKFLSDVIILIYTLTSSVESSHFPLLVLSDLNFCQSDEYEIVPP